MDLTTPSAENAPETSPPDYRRSRSLGRLLRYSLVRAVTLFAAVVVGLYLTILIANFGGYIDTIYEGMINEALMGIARGGGPRDVPPEQREARLDEIRWQMEEDYGLHEPFLSRTWNWLLRGLTLDFGQTRYSYIPTHLGIDVDTRNVATLVRLALPYTLALTGISNLLVLLLSLSVALFLARGYGGFWDRLLVALSPLSSIPSWVHGIWLVVLLAGQWQVLPYPRQIEILGVPNWWDYLPFLIQFMALPFLAIFMGSFFQSVYFWRSYFLIYAGEDYVELARAKGLPPALVQQNHVLRPTLPYIVTHFALTMIGMWQGAIALEVLFYWQGVGSMFARAVRFFDTPLIVGIVVTFAYLLAATVFVLDLLYAL